MIGKLGLVKLLVSDGDVPGSNPGSYLFEHFEEPFLNSGTERL